MLWIPSSGSTAEPAPDLPFIFKGKERTAHSKCLLNFGRGTRCEQLMQRLCSRIQYKNKECRRLRVEICHKENRPNDSKKRTCGFGTHTFPCYGNSLVNCDPLEELVCLDTDYSDRFCDFHQWRYCISLGFNEQGQFKTSKCRKYNNRELIKWNEDKLYEALEWEAKGEQNIKSMLKILIARIDELNNAIDDLESKKSWLEEAIKSATGTILEGYKQQLKQTKKQLEKMKKEVAQLSIKKKEYSYMDKLCKKYSPYH